MATKKNNNSDSVCERLLLLMEQRGMTKAHFARELGVSNAHVANWLNGQMPRADQLLLIARFFQTTMEYLLTGSGPAPPRAPAESGSIRELKGETQKLLRQLEAVEQTAARLRSFLG